MAAGRGLRTIILGALLLLAGAALGIGAAAVRDGAAYAGRIYPGVAISGIAVGGRAADRPAVAHLGIANLAGRVRDDRALAREEIARREVVVARERADRDPVPGVADVAELAEAADVDEEAGPGEAELHQRQQGMPAGEELRVTTRAEQPDGVLDGAGQLVVERGRDHFATSCNARHTRSGEAGMSMSVMP